MIGLRTALTHGHGLTFLFIFCGEKVPKVIAVIIRLVHKVLITSKTKQKIRPDWSSEFLANWYVLISVLKLDLSE